MKFSKSSVDLNLGYFQVFNLMKLWRTSKRISYDSVKAITEVWKTTGVLLDLC